MHHEALVPQLTDGVIVLDAHTEADISLHVAGEDEETARRFGWWPNRSTEAAVRDAYEAWSDDWTCGRSRRTFATRRARDHSLVGGCELRLQPDAVTGHVSYWTHQLERGNGYSRRALALMSSYAAGLGLTRLEGHVAVDNIASRRVLEASGFAQVARYDDEKGTCMIRYERHLNNDDPSN